MQEKHYNYNAGSFIINIDSYENDVPSGQFCQINQGETSDFQSLMQLLMKMEQAMEIDNEPQAFTVMRTFSVSPLLVAEYGEMYLPNAGKLATFSVQILFRRNASWQGRITWMEGKKSCNFRSALEFMVLMNSAISEKQMCSTV